MQKGTSSGGMSAAQPAWGASGGMSTVQQQVQSIFGEVAAPRYVIMLTDEAQTRVFKVREVSLSEMIAILEANGLLTNGVADLRGVESA